MDNPALPLEEIASQAITDVIASVADGADPLNQKLIAITATTKRLSEDCGDDVMSTSQLGLDNDQEKPECPVPSLPMPKTISTQGIAVSYLLRFYNNINLYEREFPKRSTEPPLSEYLQKLRTLVVDHLVLVLHGAFGLEKCKKSPLLPYVLNGNTPSGLIPELLQTTYSDKETFEQVNFYNLFFIILTRPNIL